MTDVLKEIGELLAELPPDARSAMHDRIDAIFADAKQSEMGQAIQAAKSSLLAFTKLMMPHPDDPDDAAMSRYQAALHHKIIAAALEEMQKGHLLRLIVNVPPRHGKSQLASRMNPAWVVGKDPYRSMILATYNQDFADDFGREVREILESERYQRVFPGTRLRTGSRSASRLVTTEGGQMSFVGRSASLTGRGADMLVIDDPIKDAQEAGSKLIRDQIWDWFTKVAYTRLMTKSASVAIIQTRWHEDDLVGRITDPKNPYYSAEEASKWKIIDLPAIAGENDVMGRKPGEPLWPERFDLKYLEGVRRIDPRGFSALYQGRPSPESGDFFKREWAEKNAYMPSDLPRDLRFYCASDHAVSTSQRADRTCIVPAGVDDNGVIWVLPEMFWDRADTERVVEAMLNIWRARPYLLHWAEKGHISKSIGPFLRKRMREREVYTAIDEIHPAADKQTRAQSIQARMAMGRVRLPRHAPWFADAVEELMKFPHGTYDDFVDALALLGLGLAKQVSAQTGKKKDDTPRPGTFAWIKWQTKMQEQEAARYNRRGW